MPKARERMYYPIVMPLDENGMGPATVEDGSVRKITFEVWDQACTSFGSFEYLADAIDFAEERNAEHEALLNG